MDLIRDRDCCGSKLSNRCRRKHHIAIKQKTCARVTLHQSSSGCRFTTRVRLRIMNRLAGFSSTATVNAARARASVRQIASVSSPYTRLSGLGG
jgi:ethanolamine ammonia-lyase small subunit